MIAVIVGNQKQSNNRKRAIRNYSKTFAWVCFTYTGISLGLKLAECIFSFRPSALFPHLFKSLIVVPCIGFGSKTSILTQMISYKPNTGIHKNKWSDHLKPRLSVVYFYQLVGAYTPKRCLKFFFKFSFFFTFFIYWQNLYQIKPRCIFSKFFYHQATTAGLSVQSEQ